MKHFLLVFLLFTTVVAHAQVGIGTATPAASAQLDVSSTTKGFLPPRMTTAERDLIGTPAAGLIIYNTTISGLQIYSGSTWYTASAATTMGAIAGSSTTNGGTITAGVLSLTPADGGNGGIVTNGTQTIGGDKIFTQSVTASSFVKTGGVSTQYLMADGSTSPRIALGPVTTPTANGATLTNGTLSLALADGTNSGIVTPFTQTFGGKKTFADSAVAKGFRATDSLTTKGFRATGTATATSFVKTGGSSSQYLMADGSTSSGTVATTMGAIGASSTTNGGTITSGVLSLTPADGGNGGIVTNGTQTIGGDKTFTQSVTASSFVKTGGVSSQYLMADGSTSPRIALGPVTAPTPNGATLTNGILSLAQADATNSGIVTTGAQTFAGNKTFSSAIKITAGTPGAGKVLTSDAAGLASWESASPCGYAIGQNVTALGGIIFYLDASGCHGLVCKPTDQSIGIVWKPTSVIPNTYLTASADCVGGGSGNTSILINNYGATATSCAPALARSQTGGGFNPNWYLPSKYELDLMYKNIGQGNVLGLGNVGGFTGNSYWSSTEIDNLSVWVEFFNVGSAAGDSKQQNVHSVRAVRAF